MYQENLKLTQACPLHDVHVPLYCFKKFMSVKQGLVIFSLSLNCSCLYCFVCMETNIFVTWQKQNLEMRGSCTILLHLFVVSTCTCSSIHAVYLYLVKSVYQKKMFNYSTLQCVYVSICIQPDKIIAGFSYPE